MSQSDQWLPMPRFLLRKAAIKNLMKEMSIEQKQVIEIGFGAGEMLRWFHAQGAQVAGVDFSQQAFEMATQRLTEFEIRQDIHLETDLNAFKDSTFDCVFAFEVLEHIEDDHAAIASWLRLLKPGGQLIISVPAHMSKWNASDEWAGHFRRYEKSDVINLFNNTQWEIKKLWNYGFPLSLVLDKLLGKSKQPEVKAFNEDIDKETLSKKSGTERKNNLLYRMISNNFMLFPFYLLQKLFYNRDLGSGYLIQVEKND